MASNEENDEVAAYLARERAALGEDADLFASGGTPEPVTTTAASSGLDEFDDFDSAPAPVDTGASAPSGPSGIDAFPSLDMMDSPVGASRGGNQEVRVTGHAGTGEEGDEEREKFESAFPDIASEPTAPSAVPYGLTPYPSQPYAAANATTAPGNYSSILPGPTFNSTAAAQSEEDTEPIRQWREKQQAEIKKRDEESLRKKEETVLKAEKAIDAFYESYNAEKEKSIRKNKEDEAAFIQELQEGISKGTSWERVTDIIELVNSQSKTIRASAPGGSDLQRMKELLLSLRREGDKAPAAGGY
ncbi:Clathrin light chain [Naganishia albida]|nr:Clathrin light chain [Naganishia albida]